MAVKKELKKEQYYSHAYKFAVEYVKTQMKKFTCEDVKDEFHKTHTEPEEPRVWGIVFKTLSKQKAIILQGYQKCKSKKGHGHPSSVWISREFSEKQSANRKANSKTQITFSFNG